MRKSIKKIFAGVMAASLIACTAPLTMLPVSAAAVTQGEYDFSNMTVRRVWFNTDDPVFLIDNYQRVWLDENVNVLAYGDYKKSDASGDLMAPMAEVFEQLGVQYEESGDEIIIVMNGQTLKLKVGSKDVTMDGKVMSGVLSDTQVPVKVNVKEKFADFNTFLNEDYYVTYLPVAYILNTFEAKTYTDGNNQSFYAAVPIFNTENVPSYDTAAAGYGYRFDEFLEKALNDSYELTDNIADNLVALQNADGGFGLIPDNTDMAQTDLTAKLGTLKDYSTLEKGSTVAQMRYLAAYITEKKPEDAKYKDAFFKGMEYLLNNQNENGAWNMAPTASKGFNGNTVIGNKVTTEVLTLLSDVAVLNNQNFVFARKEMDTEAVKAAVDKGNAFLLKAQVVNDGVKAGWATQVKADGTVTMGRTYERESVSSFTTKDVVEYLMTVHNPSQEIIDAVEGAATWLNEVKIADKEQKVVEDISMNNGFDVYLVDGNGTWASNYVYELDTKNYRPLYSDVDPARADQAFVNDYELYRYTNGKTSYNAADMILYATRTTLNYYDNNLGTVLLGETYNTWKEYLANGFPDIPADPSDETPGGDGNHEENPTVPGVDNPADQSNTPTQTGDNARTGLFVLLGGVSIAVIGGCGAFYVYTKKKKTAK